jgi:glycosyltransferase involved in cell wall biosynthesis
LTIEPIRRFVDSSMAGRNANDLAFDRKKVQEMVTDDQRTGDRRLRPLVVQHSSGEPGAGGPATGLERVLTSRLADKYEFVRMHQRAGNGALGVTMMNGWTRQLRALRPDLVHVRGLQNEGFQAVVAARMAGCRKILVSVHGTVRDLKFQTRSLRRWLLVHAAEPATLRLASHVATVCRYAAERKYIEKCDEKFIGIIPNGVEVPVSGMGGRERLRAEMGISADSPVMITVSRLTWEKGFRTLREAVSAIPRRVPFPTLLVVGEGPDRAEIQKAFLGVSNVAVRFLGQRSDITELLAAADIFVFPTLHENLSNALLEAMAHGLPVVASAVGGNVELLESGGGLLVPPSDAAALSRSLESLLWDPDNQQALGKVGSDIVTSSYSLDAMLNALDHAYETVISGRP